jgi:2',3'-cyclic-nucleotide 2'-phosphodiesterase/3'-nucleotidase
MCQNCPDIPAADPADPETRASSRRAVLTGGAALAAAGFVTTAVVEKVRSHRPAPGGQGHRTRLTVLGSTDLHGHALNWDYYKNTEYDDAAHGDVGIAKVATMMDAVREQRRGEPILTIDAGDTIQGTPLSYYYAVVDPITQTNVHPMSRAMNLMGYDAAALGNHDFNYGVPLLRTWERQLDFPLLGANVVDPATKMPVFRPYVVKRFRTAHGRDLDVGILGLTTPGIAIWDKAHTEGRMEFPGLVEQAATFVPEMRRRGCDVVIVSAHSGADTYSSYGDALPYPENASSLLAQHVPGIDAILVGHAHVDIPQRYVTNEKTGKQVLLCEPYCWGFRLAVMDLHLAHEHGSWRVTSATSQNLNSNVAAPKPAIVEAVRPQHEKVVTYVNSVIGTCSQEMSAARAVVEDVPIIDFVNHVQASTVKAALGSSNSLPVLSVAAPFNRSASFPSGRVALRDVAGLYVADNNTLLAVRMSGKDVRDYLEYDMAYFQRVSGAGPFTMSEVTNAKTPHLPDGTPDFTFDSVAGLDHRLTYDIDIAKPVGSRITGLAYDGSEVSDDQQFALAVSSFRQSGGGGFPAVSAAEVLWRSQLSITRLLIDWVTEHKTIDPATFASVDWRLVSDGAHITVT